MGVIGRYIYEAECICDMIETLAVPSTLYLHSPHYSSHTCTPIPEVSRRRPKSQARR